MPAQLIGWDAPELVDPGLPVLLAEALAFETIAPAPEVVGRVLLESLVERRSVHSRNSVAWLSARAWRHAAKKDEIAMFKAAKLALNRQIIGAAGNDIAAIARLMFGTLEGWTVSTTAVGHSRRPDSFAVRVARHVARKLHRPFVKVFDDRFVAGVSHPKEFSDLPPLVLRYSSHRPILLVDDVATSGWHLEEAMMLLRARGIPAFGIVWISGTIK